MKELRDKSRFCVNSGECVSVPQVLRIHYTGYQLCSSDIREIEFLAKFYLSELLVVRVHSVNSRLPIELIATNRLLIVIKCDLQVSVATNK